MSKRKQNITKIFLIIYINIILLITTQEYNSLYFFPIEILGPHHLPAIPIYFKDYSLIPNFMLLDINIEKSWLFVLGDSDSNQNNKEIINSDFYSVLGYKNEEKIYLNTVAKIDDFCYLKVNQTIGQHYYPGVFSLNRNMNEYNIITKLKYDSSNMINNIYLGFCLDFTKTKNNQGMLSVGNMHELNRNVLQMTRFPIYEEEEENEKNKSKNNKKWSIKLNGLFIGPVNSKLNETNDENKIIYKINRKYNKGLIIDESAYIETKYNSIYVTKEAMLFLSANYFKDKEEICFRQYDMDENNYEIKYNCLKSQKEKIKNINLIFENNVTMQLTSDDLLNCAINQNLNIEDDEKSEMCEFNIKYNPRVDHYSLGLSTFRKYKTYFMINDNSIILEGNNFLHCYLDNGKFSNISRSKKRSLGQTIKELFRTTLCITFIFVILYGIFYLYEKYYIKKEFRNKEFGETINREKYANL